MFKAVSLMRWTKKRGAGHKKLVAELLLDKTMLQDVAKKKW